MIKKIEVSVRAIVCVEFAHVPHICVGFLWDSDFFPHPRDVQLGELVCLYFLSLHEYEGMRISVLCDGRLSCPGCVPPCILSCWESLWPPMTPN